MTDTDAESDPAARFRMELAALGIRRARPKLARWLTWIGCSLLILAAVLLAYGYDTVHGTDNPLDQRDGMTLALVGVGTAVIGSALFLYGALTDFLRFWMVRLGHELRR